MSITHDMLGKFWEYISHQDSLQAACRATAAQRLPLPWSAAVTATAATAASGPTGHGLAAVMRYMKLAHLFGGIEVGSASGRLARPESGGPAVTFKGPWRAAAIRDYWLQRS